MVFLFKPCVSPQSTTNQTEENVYRVDIEARKPNACQTKNSSCPFDVIHFVSFANFNAALWIRSSNHRRTM